MLRKVKQQCGKRNTKLPKLKTMRASANMSHLHQGLGTGEGTEVVIRIGRGLCRGHSPRGTGRCYIFTRYQSFFYILFCSDSFKFNYIYKLQIYVFSTDNTITIVSPDHGRRERG